MEVIEEEEEGSNEAEMEEEEVDSSESEESVSSESFEDATDVVPETDVYKMSRQNIIVKIPLAIRDD